ncbi:MAG: hypothetical protein KC457_25985, partial [Myxococcales bacterium]|nr:hypothetical protein [Myxococcales bacterium]
LRGSLELRGLEAILWRDAFDQIDSDKIPEVFTGAELQRILPIAALDLQGLEWENQWELEQPLIARFSASVRNGGVVQGGMLATLAATVPIDQSTGYTRLPERWSGMVIGYAPVLEAAVTLRLKGRRFAEVPADVELTSKRGEYRRKRISGGVGDSELVFESRSTLAPGIVEVGDYDELVRFSQRVQAAEQQLLRAK